ncbi:sec1 family domain containing protein, putative [Plasmodium knowlesi strain H]|uniref:Sec1 family domain containing protein, putative n=3 Tax=Plasmodium knowlesi TaxID=5850 RepID=A0A5K1UCG5_PLAKH|nr:Sec1 family protein, putative [Plasmodium knowlesi strain H]OTN68337.1 putative Sec1 family domain containing protein [Plasmodium knowlesi]CAA9987242.1 Sec1 family protein, putative [Plasmodium knowlesi strain H]SBO24013.1 sec1 family domain containing protein, putative [Plasmodium knowlesi strain H]SBO26013.1 sec1 family domain containing protein, putative [Plasmodium knowlesi strain H]VVS76716.1 Sec1 family protein, putative [Plasmodium knowlesi strain H]|eukprot:XP_002261864.1 sec1 family domain containing protein, putative [Plasmodium knowlesi strain H]
MSLNIQEQQKNSAISMLNLNEYNDNLSSSGNILYYSHDKIWKILIYDSEGQNILAPLLKVGNLRHHGVTLNLNLHRQRSNIPEVNAVYLIDNNKENIDKIVKDMCNNMYGSYYINFISYVCEENLGYFANECVKYNVASHVSKITDRYLKFVSLSSSTFSLNIPNCFKIFHTNEDQVIKDVMDRITEGLISFLVTLGIIPIIRVSSNSSYPSKTIAEKLHRKIYELVNMRSTNNYIFNSKTVQRPVLILVDREVDLSVMVQHAWTYQALIHDVFDIKLNKISLRQGGESGTGASHSGNITQNTSVKNYDIDNGDTFFSTNCNKPFPEVANNISECLNEYNEKMKNLNKNDKGASPSGGGGVGNSVGGDNITGGLMSAMNILPEMTEHKRLLDMHTNILTELIKNIKDRELDKYYENEFDFESCNEKVCIQHMKDILTSSKGTSMDKYRAFLCLYLAKKYMNKQALDTFLQDLKNINIDISAIYFINQLEKLKTMNIHIHVGTPLTHSNSGTTTTFKDQLNTYSNIFIDKGMNILQGAKILLPKRREIKITKLVETLIENKPSSLNEQFVYIDPKTPPSDITTGSNHLERNYIKQDHVKDYIVFVIGGGNYIEVSALKDLEEKMNKKIIYGTTDFVRPENFVQELNQIGHAFSP